ncbi:Chitinase 2 [Coemansia biformis]|uniref:chitinase n=1 Tax=Coemansia biformis TaxID=1286918 RepID=A0A9W7YAW6_9FUNG|nr:Chitinase 2 [Coemansia biformis]
MRQLALVAALLLGLLCAHGQQFDIRSNSNLVMYWGQNSHAVDNPGENQLPLDEYCDKNSGDVLVLSFLSEFESDNLRPPKLNFANSCVTSFENSTLLHCSGIGKAISKCQKQGKVVLLSMGGARGSYGFTDDMQAERYADRIWDLFLGGDSHTRPFDNAVLDGIDLDIEGGSAVGYVRFVQRLRERFTEVTGRRFYVTAAPQCPYPDFYAGPILDNAYLDMVFVQFYNNYCGVDHPNWFNFEQWHEWATTIAANKDVRVFLGVPGSRSAASSGHVPPEKLKEIINTTRSMFDSFGGVMVWDASQAETNQVTEDTTFAAMIRQVLDSGKKPSDEVSESDDSTADTSSHNGHAAPPGAGGKPAPATTLVDSATTSAPKSGGAGKTGGTAGNDVSIASASASAPATANAEVSEVETGGQSAADRASGTDGGHLAAENLNRVAVGGAQESAADSSTADNETESSSSSESKGSVETDKSGVASTDGAGDADTDSPASDDAPNDDAKSASDGSTEDAEQSSGAEQEQKNEADSAPAEESGDDTTTVQSTKVIHMTSTRTRRIHIVTKHVTTRVRKSTDYEIGSLTAPSPVTSNKTISIVTPTFPLPIARCPRADQPCIGAGFACNGYEFGQCVNNRWLMRPCSTDRITACFNAGPDLIACDFTKGRSLQVCDDILAPLPYGRLASNVLFLRGSDQERALNTPVYPVPSVTPTSTHVKKKKKDDDDDDDDTDYNYNKYGEKKKNTSTSTITDMELVKQSSGVNLIDDHNRREDPAMLMVKDPEAYYGPDGHVRVVGGNVVDDLRKHNSLGTANEPYDENPPVDDPEEADEYSEGEEFMRKRDFGAWDDEVAATSSALAAPLPAAQAHEPGAYAGRLAVRSSKKLVGESVSMAHLNEKPWRAQVEDFYSIYALFTALAGVGNDMAHQQFERAILEHIDGDFLVAPRLPALAGRPLLARFTFVPVRGDDPNYMHYRTKDGMVEQDVLVAVRMATNIPIPKRWRVALPLPLNATMLHTSRGSFYAGDRVSAEVKSLYVQRVAFYNENIRMNTNKQQSGPETQKLNDLAAGHSSNRTEAASPEFDDGPSYNSVRRSLISPAVISQILHKKPAAPPPPELLDEPITNDPAGRLYEVRSNPDAEKSSSMALYFTIRIKTRPTPDGHVVGALPHPILSFITTY